MAAREAAITAWQTELRKARLTAAFKALRAHGYFARQRWQCCQGCGWAAMPEARTAKAVFYHAQDAAHLDAADGLYLAWAGDGHEIAGLLAQAGLTVTWDGDTASRILVQ